MFAKLNVYLIDAGKSEQTDTFQGSLGVLFDRISSYIRRTIAARIYLLLTQITLRDRTANMRLRTLVAEVFLDFSLLLIKKNLWDQGRNRITRPIRLNGRHPNEGRRFRTTHEVPRVKIQTRVETDHHVARWMWTARSIPVTETEVEFCDL